MNNNNGATLASASLPKLNSLTSKILMPIMFILLFLYSTVVNKLMDGAMETAQNLIGFIILCIIFSNFLNGGIKWVKNYVGIPATVYIIIRLIGCYLEGNHYVTIRSIFFEVFCIVGICAITAGNTKNVKKYALIFLALETIFSAISFFIFLLAPHFESLREWAFTYTLYESHPTASFFVNRNTAGIMIGVAILILIACIGNTKSKNSRIFACLLLTFHILNFLLQNCRSAEVALFAVAIAFVLKKYKSFDRKKIVISILVLCLCAVGIIYAFIGYNLSTHPEYLTPFETKLNYYSAERYSIWQECFIEQKEHPFFGAGSLAKEQWAREVILNVYDNNYADVIKYFTNYGPHSGYISMISVSGWLGFAAFIWILLYKIKKSKLLKEGNWYLLVIFTLVVNLFESLFILNRFFLCFFMFMILEAEPEPDEESDKLLSC